MWYTPPPPKKMNEYRHRKKGTMSLKGNGSSSTWCDFQRRVVTFSGGVFEVYRLPVLFLVFPPVVRNSHATISNSSIHCVFFLGGDCMIHDATAQPDWDMRMMNLDQVSPILFGICFKNHPEKTQMMFQSVKQRGGCQLCCTFIEVCGTTSRRHSFASIHLSRECLAIFWRWRCLVRWLSYRMGRRAIGNVRKSKLSCLPAVLWKNCHAHCLTVFFQSCCSVLLWHEKPGLLKKQLRVELGV